ncbi:HBS1-like protein [Sphaceloma murrayae]|uniref:Elongation factor 1 alpha-like protein n=1 Tax=Sphaceloma murrayae TaxID=2082308 RepID=A0A2K1QJH1_9PEZI|nr:HBS1-like protein [Sphaceloma murrayae]
MSGHRRVKNVDYDDADDYDDYDDDVQEVDGPTGGDDELTEEDREQLRIGTAKVRSIIQESSHISNRTIEDALWHYYYDIEKTVVYLKNEHQPTTPKAKKPSRFDQAAAASAEKNPVPSSAGKSYSLSTDHLGRDHAWKHVVATTEYPAPARANTELRGGTGAQPRFDVFAGITWSAPTPETRCVFTPIERRPRLRLLGGSGKPSKLAALAAARKKEKENQASGERVSGALSLLDRLNSKDMALKEPTATPLKVDKAEPMPVPPEKRTISSLATRSKRPSVPSAPAEPVKAQQLPIFEPPKKALPTVEQLSSGPSSFGWMLSALSQSSADPLSPERFQHNLTLALLRTLDVPSQESFRGPSPDAVVLRAQAKGKTTGQPSQSSKETRDTKQVTKAVGNLSVAPPPPPPVRIKSKNLNVPFEYANAKPRKELNFVVVGHIDHGKSTLMGRLLYEHNVIDARSLEKFRKEAAKLGKESFHLAWVMDAREDEREHGVTIDYAEKNFSTASTDFTIIDAPGHRDYVGNMIAGTAMADFALLVVDAGANSFAAGLKGQTREHAQIVRSHKLEKIIVVVNKMDSVSWSKDAFNSVMDQTTSFLAEQLFNPADVIFVPVSGLSGENITARPGSSNALWYTGPSLVQALDNIQPKREQYLGKISDPFRLRVAGFSGLSELAEFLPPGSQAPFTVYGRVDAGTCQVGDRLTAQPSGETVVIKVITKGGEPRDYAVPGQIIGIQLVECDEDRLARGDLLCGEPPVRATKKVTMKILAFDVVFPMPVDVHRGRMRAYGRVAELVSRLDRTTHAVVKNKPKIIKTGETARVTVEFDESTPLERGERVVLRYAGVTVAAGAVEKGEA